MELFGFDVIELMMMCISYGIVAGSFVLKVPQIVNFVRAQSVEGYSLVMGVLEIVGYGNAFAYGWLQGHKLMDYMENGVLVVEVLVIFYLLLHYNKYNKIHGMLGVVMWASLMYFVMLGAVLPKEWEKFLQFSTIPIFAASRVPQIWSNYKNGNTGVLSWITTFLSFGGSAARTMTGIFSVGDPVVAIGYITGTLLNGIVLAQIVWYTWLKKEKKKEE